MKALLVQQGLSTAIDEQTMVKLKQSNEDKCDAPKSGCPLTTRQPAETLVNVG